MPHCSKNCPARQKNATRVSLGLGGPAASVAGEASAAPSSDAAALLSAGREEGDFDLDDEDDEPAAVGRFPIAPEPGRRGGTGVGNTPTLKTQFLYMVGGHLKWSGSRKTSGET